MSRRFLTAVDAATELGVLARHFAAAFDSFARLSADRERPAADRVWLATFSRLCGQCAQTLADLVPESVLLADARAAAESAPVVLPEDPHEALDALIDQLKGLIARADPVANAPVLRSATAMVRDLEVADR